MKVDNIDVTDPIILNKIEEAKVLYTKLDNMKCEDGRSSTINNNRTDKFNICWELSPIVEDIQNRLEKIGFIKNFGETSDIIKSNIF